MLQPRRPAVAALPAVQRHGGPEPLDRQRIIHGARTGRRRSRGDREFAPSELPVRTVSNKRGGAMAMASTIGELAAVFLFLFVAMALAVVVVDGLGDIFDSSERARNSQPNRIRIE